MAGPALRSFTGTFRSPESIQIPKGPLALRFVHRIKEW